MAIEWTMHESDEVWDYEKEFYECRLRCGKTVWVYPNASRLWNLTDGGELFPSSVVAYRENSDAYFKQLGFLA